MGLEHLQIGFIGFGKMAQTICKRIIASKQVLEHQIFFARKNKEKAHAIAKELNIKPASIRKIFHTCNFILFCVKPQNLNEVLEEWDEPHVKSQLFLSIITGKKIKAFKEILGDKAQVIRFMPNTPSSIGEGVSAICFDKSVTLDNQLTAKLFLSSLGIVIEIQEKEMDITTGLSGSGPAFVYKMIDAFARAGEKGGLSYKKALEMAAQTFIGAATLVSKEKDIDSLLEMITTKGGTTQAGLDVIEEKQIGKNMQEVILAAAKRSCELSK